jgi:hypothetical protein
MASLLLLIASSLIDHLQKIFLKQTGARPESFWDVKLVSEKVALLLRSLPVAFMFDELPAG